MAPRLATALLFGLSVCKCGRIHDSIYNARTAWGLQPRAPALSIPFLHITSGSLYLSFVRVWRWEMAALAARNYLEPCSMSAGPQPATADVSAAPLV
jgi:hypothetical protein